MARTTKTASPEVQAVLQQATITATSVKLEGQLDRKLYVEVDKFLRLAGGKWSRRDAAHIFDSDPREILGLAAAGEAVVDEKKLFQAFYTPPDVAKLVIAEADIRPGMYLLEPSAGEGALLDAVPAGVGMTSVEMNPKAHARLIGKGYKSAICADFLTWQPSIPRLYDRVVMNPPFTGDQDMTHVMKALTHVKAGGKLVAIMSPRFGFVETATAESFRSCLAAHDSTVTPLPSGSFKSAGTAVNTVLVVIKVNE